MKSVLRWLFKKGVAHLTNYYKALCHEQPAVPFLILGEARTGTNLLADLLRQHPEIAVAGEILNPYNPEGIRTWLRPKRWVVWHIKRSLKALEGKCRGAQTHIYHFQIHRLPLAYLVGCWPQLRFLVLYRENLAEQYVSWKLAKQSGRWVGVSDSAVHRGKCIVVPEEFLKWCDSVRSRYAEASSCLGLWERAITLSYEELSRYTGRVLTERVFPFLDVDPVPVFPRLRKQNARPLCECVANFAEVRDLLEKQRLESIGPTR